MNFIVTGGAGFIGSHFVEHLVKLGHRPIVIDALTYAGDRDNLSGLSPSDYIFIEANICDGFAVAAVLNEYKPRAVFNFAAESHVDRSITGPAEFLKTNVMGTSTLLTESLKAWESWGRPADFRYVQVSTDEVFGSLGENGQFSEESPYAPNSPYSASKAGADFLVRAWHHTYGLPTLTTYCSNNYGPRQYPEKLIPAMITRALAGETIGIYGDGRHVRDWLHVGDHCAGIWQAFLAGAPGGRYCFGGNCEMKNLAVAELLCDMLQDLRPRVGGGQYRDLITFVADRKGHDRRYAIDFSKARKDLGFAPTMGFKEGLWETLRWYLR